MNPADHIKDIQSTFTKVFEEIPSVNLRKIEKHFSFGYVIFDNVYEYYLLGKKHLLFVDIQSNGQPRYARQAISGLQMAVGEFENSYGIFCAPYISTKVASLCRDASIGYLDLAGNCNINYSSIFIKVEGMKNPKPQKRELRTIFSRKASRVLHTLLSDPYKSWKNREIVDKSQTSQGLIFNVTQKLIDHEWGEKSKDGFTLTNPLSLLKDWSRNYSQYAPEPKLFETFKSSFSISETESRIKDYCRHNDPNIDYALSLFSGASKLGIESQRINTFAYVNSDFIELANHLDLTPDTINPDVTLIYPDDDFVFRASHLMDGFNVVSNIQLYLDLLNIRRPGDEIPADHNAAYLLENVIVPSWKKG